MSGSSKSENAAVAVFLVVLFLLPFAFLYLCVLWFNSRRYVAVAKKWGWTAKKNEYHIDVAEPPARPDSLAALFARVTDQRVLPASHLSEADIRQLAAQYQTGDAPVLAFISNDPIFRVPEIGLVVSREGIHWLDKDGKPLMLPWKKYELRCRGAVLEGSEIKLTGSTYPSRIPAPFYGDLIQDFLAAMAKLMVDDNATEPVSELFTPTTSLISAFGKRIDGEPIEETQQENLIALLQSPWGLVLAFILGFLLVGVARQFFV